MTRNRWMLPGILVVASAGIVLAVYLSIGGRGGAAPVQGARSPAMLARDGVRAMDQDSARRGGDEIDASSSPPNPLAANRPYTAAELDERQRPQAPPDPGPPVVLGEAEQAAQDAVVALREQVADEVRAQLGSQSAALKKACWTPELAGEASSASFSVNASFDPSGALVASGISDSREGGGAPGVGQCLRQQALALAVAPPGLAITVDVALRLP